MVRVGGGWNPSLEFLISCCILKQFYLKWKAIDLLNKMRKILWVVVLLEACDIWSTLRVYIYMYKSIQQLVPQDSLTLLLSCR